MTALTTIFVFSSVFASQTRMQCLRPSPGAIYTGISDAIKTMVRTEGALSPFRGMKIVALGAGPAHALYFSSYETTKKYIGSLGSGNHSQILSFGMFFLLCIYFK